MRVSKIRWVSHSKTTILSVDVQPSGYRFITGGADAYVRIWNLMPVISAEHEAEGEDSEEGDEEGSMQLGEPGEEGGATESAGQKRRSGVSSRHDQEDSKMQGDDDSEEDSRSPEERLKDELIEKEYEKDTKLMESLFPDEPSKAKRLLATLEGHQAPINCVRWNNLGTIFASADDEGTINLW
mmetsp:Transcript_12777/g.17199  ORF Transcript_12777/g.17199 Transcript_12777/m.17199 type:complete len:183 (+) Transcript_12777:31-579(+)